MSLDVLPQGLDDLWTSFCCDSEHLRIENSSSSISSAKTLANLSQSGMEFEFHGLVVEQQEDGAFDRSVPGSFHLESVGLVRGGRSVPLHQMIVGSVDLLVQFNYL